MESGIAAASNLAAGPKTVKTACVAVAKDEERGLAEWIAFQLTIGFDTVIVYENGSVDNTANIVRAFGHLYDVRLVDWPVRSADYQFRAYSDAIRRFEAQFDWIAFFDTDEFLVLDEGLHLPSLLSQYNASAVSVSWAMFGSSGLEDRNDQFVIEAFLHRSLPSFGPNRHVKTIAKPECIIDVSGVHSFSINGNYVDLVGRALGNGLDILPDVPDYKGGKLHHYFTKSKQEWTHKILHRGYRDIIRAESEFNTYDRNEVLDCGAEKFADDVRALILQLESPLLS